MNFSNQLTQLKEQLKAIDSRCQHWKKFQDGSYEMALNVEGYHKLAEQIELLEGIDDYPLDNSPRSSSESHTEDF